MYIITSLQMFHAMTKFAFCSSLAIGVGTLKLLWTPERAGNMIVARLLGISTVGVLCTGLPCLARLASLVVLEWNFWHLSLPVLPTHLEWNFWHLSKYQAHWHQDERLLLPVDFWLKSHTVLSILVRLRGVQCFLIDASLPILQRRGLWHL